MGTIHYSVKSQYTLSNLPSGISYTNSKSETTYLLYSRVAVGATCVVIVSHMIVTRVLRIKSHGYHMTNMKVTGVSHEFHTQVPLITIFPVVLQAHSSVSL